MTMNGSRHIGNFQLTWAGTTDVGKVRKVNEDSLLARPGLFVVADGMGGHAAGDVASRLTIESFAEWYHEGSLPLISSLTDVVSRANETVLAHSHRYHLEGMGSTAVGSVMVDNGGEPALVVFNVGDSRCYVVEDGRLRQITKDHSLVQELVDDGSITAEEASHHPHRNVVTRAIGIDSHVAADFTVLSACAERRLMFCSDGVSGELEFDALERLLCDSHDPPAAVAAVVEAVLTGRAADNLTVIVVDVTQAHLQDIDLEVTGQWILRPPLEPHPSTSLRTEPTELGSGAEAELLTLPYSEPTPVPLDPPDMIHEVPTANSGDAWLTPDAMSATLQPPPPQPMLLIEEAPG
jgi:serine/threonine protein phosphatase PrpC